jgi:hypothetical protein
MVNAETMDIASLRLIQLASPSFGNLGLNPAAHYNAPYDANPLQQSIQPSPASVAWANSRRLAVNGSTVNPNNLRNCTNL